MQGDSQSQPRLDIRGTGSAGGGVYGRVSIHGRGTVEGDLECVGLHVHGTASVNGAITAKRVDVHGTFDVHGKLAAAEVSIRGMLKIGGDCNADSVHLDGGINMKGMLSADRIEMQVYAPSRVDEIGGEFIQVRAGRSFPKLRGARLVAEMIEGDRVDLEYTRAKVVRGARVRIGRGCEVGRVEYSEDLQQDAQSSVVEKRRLD